MEAVVPAFVVALLCQLGDRSPWLAALLAERYRSAATVLVAALLAHGLGNGVAAVAGALIAPTLSPNARALLLAMALLFGAIGALWPTKPPARPRERKLGALATAFPALLITAAGDSTQFFTLALAARSAAPWNAAIGATLGVLAVHIIAVSTGELVWRRLPHRVIRTCVGLMFLLAALVTGAGALRLI